VTSRIVLFGILRHLVRRVIGIRVVIRPRTLHFDTDNYSTPITLFTATP